MGTTSVEMLQSLFGALRHRSAGCRRKLCYLLGNSLSEFRSRIRAVGFTGALLYKVLVLHLVTEDVSYCLLITYTHKCTG